MVTRTELENWIVTTTCLDGLKEIDYAAMSVKQYSVKALIRYSDGKKGYHFKNYAFFSKPKLQLAIDDLRSNIFVDEFIIYDEFNNEQRWERKLNNNLEVIRSQIISQINQVEEKPVIIDEGYHMANLKRWIDRTLKNEAHSGSFETTIGGRKYILKIDLGCADLYDGKGHLLKRGV